MLNFFVFPTGVSAEGGFAAKVVEFLGKMRSTSVDYETWSQLSLKDKVLTYDWTTELYVLATFAIYILAYLWGRSKNSSMVNSFMESVDPVLNAEFGVVGVRPHMKIVKDNDSRYTTYASGRENIESLLARFRLSERSNLMNYVFSLAMPQMGSLEGLPDNVHIELTPTFPNKLEPGVFAVVNKENLGASQEQHYFLKYTKTVDHQQGLPPLFALMVENNEQVQDLYTPELKQALDMEGSAGVLRMLAFSDLPEEEPTKESQVSGNAKVYLEFNFPSNAAQRAAVAKITEAAIHFVDALVEKPAYRSSTQKKIAANRDIEYKRIRKADEEVQREKLEANKAKERREAARRELEMSDEEQRKLQKKKQEKQARKQRKTQKAFK